MKRFLFFITVLILLTSIELALVSSLPFPFSTVPVVIIVSVLYLQTYQTPYAVIWIMLFGLILDLLQLHILPFATLAYGLSAGCAFIMSRSLFSNRSFYGVLGATISVLVILSVLEFVTLFIMQLVSTPIISVESYLSYVFWRIVTATIFLLILFPINRSFIKNIYKRI
jgi:hypothetical protein